MNLPIIINYFECENCFHHWRLFKEKDVFRSCCIECDTWNRRERKIIITYMRSDYRAYGKFECVSCDNTWTSAFAWILYKQKCLVCKKKSFPFRLYDKYIRDDYLNGNSDVGEGKGHKREYCDKCWEIGDCRKISFY